MTQPEQMLWAAAFARSIGQGESSDKATKAAKKVVRSFRAELNKARDSRDDIMKGKDAVMTSTTAKSLLDFSSGHNNNL